MGNEEILKKRIQKFENYIEENSFDELISRVIEEQKKRGFEIKNMTNKLNFIMSYLSYKKTPVDEDFDCEYDNDVFYMKGYYFQVIFALAEGLNIKIFDEQGNELLMMY